MIKSTQGKEADAIANNKHCKLPPEIISRAKKVFAQINAARDIFELRVPPSNHLKKLEGPRPAPWSIRNNDQWRVVFYWDDVEGDAYHVQITDYH